MNSNEPKPAPRFKERVIKNGLTFAGKPYAEGDTIEITEHERARLRKRGFVADAGATAAKPATPKE